MPNKIDVSILEIRTDHSAALKGFKEVELRGAALGKSVEQVGRTMSGSMTNFGSSLSKVSGLLAGFGVSLGVGAIVSFGKSLLDDADAMVEMSDRTGASIRTLQMFQAAGDDAGNSVEDLTGAMVKLQDKIGSGDSAAASALRKIGIELKDIQNLSPENQFFLIADALRDVHSQTELVAIGTDIFGKSFQTILPTIKRGFDDLKDGASGASEETVRTLAEANDIIAAMGRNFKVSAAEGVVALAHLVQDGLKGYSHEAGEAARQAKALNDELERMANAVPIPKGLPQLGQLAPIDPNGRTANQTIEASNKILRDQEAARKKASDALKSWNDDVAKSTIAMNLSIFALHRFGAVELPNVTSSMAAAIAETRDWVPPLEDATGEIEDLQRSGRFAAATLIDVGQQIMLMPAGLDAASTAMARYRREQDEAAASAKTFSQKLGAELMGVLEGVPQTLANALTGGGGLLGAAASIGSQVGSTIGKNIGATLGKLGGPIGAALGSLVGPLIDKLFGGPSKKELEGRDVVANFERQFKNVGDMITKVGAAYIANGKSATDAQKAIQKLWAAEKQGAEATKRALEEINTELEKRDRIADAISAAGFQSQAELDQAAELARDVMLEMTKSGEYSQAQIDKATYNWQKALAEAGDAAAAAWVKAHDAAQSATEGVSDAISQMVKERDDLQSSIANEAYEEEMGSEEEKVREQIDNINKRIEEEKRQVAERVEDEKRQNAEMAAQLGNDIEDAARRAAATLGQALQDAMNGVRVPDWKVNGAQFWDTSGITAADLQPMEGGGFGRATAPTMRTAVAAQWDSDTRPSIATPLHQKPETHEPADRVPLWSLRPLWSGNPQYAV